MSSVVVQTIETQAHRIINKHDGIIRIYSKPSHIDEDDIKALFTAFTELQGEEKLIVLQDPTEENSMSANARKLVMKHMKDHVAIFAVIGRKKFIRSLFKVISTFVDIGVEMQMFESEVEAEKWLRTKLK